MKMTRKSPIEGASWQVVFISHGAAMYSLAQSYAKILLK